MNPDQKLEQWAERVLKQNLDQAILPDDDNGYVAFGKYHIQPGRSGVSVSTWADKIHCFMNKRHAITWCILDHKGNYSMANRMIVLDSKKQTISNDTNTRRFVGERMRDPDLRETVQLKISTKLQTLTAVNLELDKCINYAKYLQTKGFINETARTSRA